MLTRWLANISLFLIAAVPFNISIHQQVMASFHAEAVAFALAVCFFVFHSLSERKIQASAGMSWALLGVLATLTSLLFVSYVYSAQWIWPLVFFTAVALVSPGLDTDGKRRVVLFLALGLVMGAVWQSLAGWFQVVRWVHNVSPLFAFFGYSNEIEGNLGHRNVYGHYLCLGAIASLWLAGHQSLRSNKFRIAAGLIAGWLIFSATLSGSRAILLYLTFWAAGSLLALKQTQETQCRLFARRLLIMVIAGFALQFMTPAIQGGLRWMSVQESELSSGVDNIDRGKFGARRIVEIKKAIEIFKESPVFGVGWGGYAKASFDLQSQQEFSGEIENALFIHSHNVFAQLAAEFGLFGLALIIWPVVAYIKSLRHTSLSGHELLFVFSAISTTAIHSLVEYPLWYLSFLVVFALLFAMVTVPMARTLTVNRYVVVTSGIFMIGGAVLAVLQINRLEQLFFPQGTAIEKRTAIKELTRIKQIPGFDAWGDLVLMNYMSLRAEHNELRHAIVTRSAGFRPYGYMQAKLVCEFGLAQQPIMREREYRKLLNAYPDQKQMYDQFFTRYNC